MVLKGLSTKKRRRRRRALAEEIPLQFDVSEWLWDVLTQEILPRLPANQLQRMKGVCRNWLEAISSPNFVGHHLKTYNEKRIRVVVKNHCRLIEYELRIDSAETTRINCPPAIHSGIRSTLLGSCDGLLCLHYEGGGSVEVYNPSTGKYFRPKLSLKDTTNISCSWFGRHPCSGVFVLVLVLARGSFPSTVGVYKFNRRSNLRKIHSTSCSTDPQVYYTFHERIGTLLHGALHWPAKRNHPRGRRLIYAYHLTDNKYVEISPPPVQCRCFKLGVVDGCLFAILKRTRNVNANPDANPEFEMWIMKEYGVEESWIKYANFEGLNSCGYGNYINDVIPLGFLPNGDLILDVDKYILINYSFNHNKPHQLLAHREYGAAIMCPDSLLSPKIVGT